MINGKPSVSFSYGEDYQLPDAPPPEKPPPPPEKLSPEEPDEPPPEDQAEPPPEEDTPRESAAKKGMADTLVCRDLPPAVFDHQILKRGTKRA
jgi:hypothetical protein